MDDLKPALERLADRLDPAPEPLGRLRDRRRRRAVRQRLVAGTLAGVLAIGATAVVWTAFRGGEEPPPQATYEPPRVLTVWPESAIPGDGTVEEVQARVDRGDQDVAWRTDPRQVVHAFVASVLGWSDASLRVQYTGRETVRWYRVTQPSSCLGAALECPAFPPDDRPTLSVQVVQPARRGEGGVWSVSTVRSSEIRLAVPQGVPGVSGTIRGVAGPANGVHTLAGARWFDGCDASSSVVDDVRRPSRFLVPLQELTPAPACGDVAAGYAYAYAVSAETEPTGDPLLESSPIVDLTIVPIRVRTADEAGATASLTESLTTYRDPLGWRVDLPDDWTMTTIATQDRVTITGAAFSNVTPGVASPTSATPSPIGLDPDALPADVVEVVIMHVEGGPAPDLTGDDTPMPVTLDGLGCSLETKLECGTGVRGNGLDYSIEVRRGADASPDDLAAAEALVASLRFPALRAGERSHGWVSLGPADDFESGAGTPTWVSDEIEVAYVMRGPEGTYLLDLDPESCGEGENETWDPETLQIWIECPLASRDVRYDRYGVPDQANPPEFHTRLSTYSVITAWDGSLLAYVAGSMGGLARTYWP